MAASRPAGEEALSGVAEGAGGAQPPQPRLSPEHAHALVHGLREQLAQLERALGVAPHGQAHALPADRTPVQGMASTPDAATCDTGPRSGPVHDPEVLRQALGRMGHAAVEAVGAVEHGVGRALEHGVQHGIETLVPAWRRVTAGEARWPVSVVITAMIALQASLPQALLLGPRAVLPAVEALLLVVLVAVNPRRIESERRSLRLTGLALIVVASWANADAVAHLVVGLVRGTLHLGATQLLVVGGSVWLVNVLVFALWYWDTDRGGPAARAHGRHCFPDFLFPQMSDPQHAHPDWEPGFVDYLYLSFTNATAFSAADTIPMTRWAKLTMLAQSAVSLVVVALVIARAVGVLQ